MENTIITNVMLDKKLEDRYCMDKTLCNFRAPQELMVEITLCEYRELVSSNAVADGKIEKLTLKNLDLEEQVKTLNERYNALKEKYIAAIGGDDEE